MGLKFLIACDCCIIGGPIMFFVGIAQLVRKKPEAIEIIIGGVVIFGFGVLGAVISKRIDAAKSSTSQDLADIDTLGEKE
jgi:hypothetical protein